MRHSIVILAAVLVGCVGPTQTRFPTDVATALRRDEMRRMETQSLVIYYPEQRRGDAERIAGRVEQCAQVLRSQALIHNSYADQKMVLVVPDVPFNNAFVMPGLLGYEPISVLPTSNTLSISAELGLPSDPSYIGCHEITHYVQALQASGFWGWINSTFGDVIPPQIGLDAWFWEGLATYYETRLQPGTGRMAWPVWRGMFHAGFADKRINGGDLDAAQRPFHWGHHYLVGSHFIEFLAQRYGEAALWKLVRTQGDSIFFPFGVALRWKSATGKSLPTLIDEFADHVEKVYKPRSRPSEQRRIRSAGTVARYATSNSGREAIILSGADMPPLLRIYDQGQLIREHSLVDIVPPRTLVAGNPILSSGLSFTGDGSLLYFVAVDPGDNRLDARLLRYNIAKDNLEVVVPQLRGAGGGVSFDGSTYYYGYADGDRHHLAAIDLATRARRMIRTAEAGSYYETPRPSPDGKRIVSSVFNGHRFVVRVLDARTGRTLTELNSPGAVYDSSWVDDHRLILLAEYEGRFQVHQADATTGKRTRITDAPYLAFQPRPFGDKIRFLNRDGWSFSVDEVPLPAAAPASAEAVATPAGPVAAGLGPTTKILSDTPYSQTDNLFSPSARMPLLLSPTANTMLVGLSLAGSDRLSFHRWNLFAQFDVIGKHGSGGFKYATALLAPLELRFEAERIAWNEVVRNDDMFEKSDFRSQHRGLIAIARNFRTSRVELALWGLEENDRDNDDAALRQRRLAGPRLSLGHAAMEGTPYTGARKGYVASATAAYYDEALSSLGSSITDVSGELRLVSPLPLSRRHTLTLSLRGRRLYGLERNQGFLIVGGNGGFAELWKRSDQDETLAPALSPEPLLAFQEPFRGFEDYSFTTDRIGIAGLSYRYPIILDYGFASVAYLLPKLFFHELDFQLFGSGATDSFASFDEHRHAAVGGSAALDLSLGLARMRIRYQLARRVTDDQALVHLVSLGI